MQRTHGFSGNRLTRALRTGAIALAAGAIIALAMQPTHGETLEEQNRRWHEETFGSPPPKVGPQEVDLPPEAIAALPEPFISGLWEHKIEVTLTLMLSQTHQDLIFESMGAVLGQAPVLQAWRENKLPSIARAANEMAIWGCGFYNREAVGPIYETQESFIVVLTYACALP